MAIYRQIYTTFWSDPKIVDDFSPEDKFFFLYLMTNPLTSLTGCYEISFKRMASELGYDSDTVKKLIKRMKYEHKVVDYDEETKEILIINWHKYNWTKSPKLISSVKQAVESVKTERFCEYLLQLIDAYENSSSDTVSIPYPYPMDTTVSVYYNNTICLGLDNVSSIDSKRDVKTKEQTNVQSTLNVQEDEVEEAFTTFWQAYPKKVNKAYARKCFTKALKKVSLDTLLSALEKHKQSVNWLKSNGQFIPDASTWLNNERWDDEIEIQKQEKRVYTEDETPYEAARWLSRKINRLHPDIEIVSEDTLQKWAAVFDKMEREDKRDSGDILCVMRFIFESDFWKDKISNPWDLRKNYVKIRMQAEKEGKF